MCDSPRRSPAITTARTPTTSDSYYLRSSVTGNVIREYDYSGALVKSDVFIGNQIIAQQSVSTGSTLMLWQHKNPVTGDTVSTDSVGHTMDIVRMDPTGVGMGDSDPSSTPQAGFGEVAGQDTSQPLMGSRVAAFFPTGGSAGCTVDGMLTGCALVNTILSADAGTQCPENDCGIHYNPRDIDGNGTIDTYWDSFQSFADGHSGYGPIFGANYSGDGHFTLPGTGPRGRPPTFAPRQANDHGANRPHGPNADPEADDSLTPDPFDPPPPPLATFSWAKFDSCLKMFGAKRGPSTSSGLAFNSKYGGVFIGRIDGKPVAVNTYVDRETSDDLGADYQKEIHQDAGPQVGFTDANFPTSNNIAKDVASDARVPEISKFAIFIHELGNALAGQRVINGTSQNTISGDYYRKEAAKYHLNDNDAGAVFEHCVFGGIVNEYTGRIGTSRN